MAQRKRMFVSRKDESVRLFKNPVLEALSHVHPATPVVVYTPVVAILLYLSAQQFSIATIVAAFLVGVVLWTFTEYSLHRWVFHYEPKSEWGQKIHFLIHGVHHDYPNDSTRLVMPLLVSAPLAVLFYYLFAWIFAPYHLPLFAGFVAGYIAYDTIHYATHHWRMEGKIGRWLKKHHMRHHFQDDQQYFGVSSPLWDYVFGTMPKRENRSSQTA